MNKMIRIVIVEDEKLAINRLVRILSNIEKEIQIVKTLSSISESVRYFKSQKALVDLILIDIHLSDGNSFEIFDQVVIGKPIIFITAYDQYALKAFQQLSVSYLLKPIQEEDLIKALDKYEQNFVLNISNESPDYSSLLKLLDKQGNSSKKRFLVQIGDKVRAVNTEEISLFYAENKSCFILTDTGKRYYINYTLEKLSEMLSELDFLRINRKVILNISNIIELVPYSKGKIRVKVKQSPGFEIFVSGDKIKQIKNWMNF